jgi:hypothetical protein
MLAAFRIAGVRGEGCEVLLTRDAIRPETLAEGIKVDVSGQDVTIALPGGDSEVVRLGSS